jgi:hypothetical protein
MKAKGDQIRYNILTFHALAGHDSWGRNENKSATHGSTCRHHRFAYFIILMLQMEYVFSEQSKVCVIFDLFPILSVQYGTWNTG